MWFVSRRRYEQELAAAKAEADRQRRRAETAAEHAATAVFNRKQVLRQNAELDAANRRLAGRNQALGERISALTEADPEYLAALEQELAAEKRRADRLQERLDDAVGLNDPRVLAGPYWGTGTAAEKGGLL